MKSFIKFLLAVIGVILKGFVLSKLWLWFIVPIFNLPILSIPIAIGISIIVAMLTYQIIDTKPDDNVEKDVKEWANAVATIIVPLLFLLEGYIVTLFM